MFSSYILRNIPGLRLVDYADQIWNGKEPSELEFRETGHAYGPVRVSAHWASPEFLRLNHPLTRPGFLRERRALFFIRDPRDILVSAFYSFSLSHAKSPVAEISEFHRREKERLRDVTVDQYCLEQAECFREEFDLLLSLREECKDGLLLKYEDMIDRFDLFGPRIDSFLQLGPGILREIKDRSRPRKKEDPRAHRRSGKTAGFAEKLSDQTVDKLDEMFGDILERFEYPTARSLRAN